MTTKKLLILWIALIIVVLLCSIVALGSYLTNPFTIHTIVQKPFHTEVGKDGQIKLIADTPLSIKSGPVYKLFIWSKSGYHMVENVYTGSKRSKSQNLENIIQDIHTLRFNPDRPFIISGDHFSMLYPRSLGIFYHTLLDPRTALSQTDWENRQRIYLQTTAYALDAFQHDPGLSTTIVPVGAHDVALLNIYQPPSDTLYSLLYGLKVMESPTEIEASYPYATTSAYVLQTATASTDLKNKFKASLNEHLNYYLEHVRDPQSGLIRKDILISSTKDIFKRQSAFYDNVILWKTQQLAQELGLDTTQIQDLNKLKQDILTNFWSEKTGCFREDLSPETLSHNYYSSDWLIVLSTRFLDPKQPAERKYYESCVKYIQAHQLDQPFGLRYQIEPRYEQEYLPVRIFAPEYGTTTIWSNLGMEYVKTLAYLYQETKNTEYLNTAQRQINAYSDNIVKTGCYPEVYNTKGEMYQKTFYKSVCQTGWVVTYEQAKKILQSVSPPQQPLKI
jgi:hypothetical protein